MGVYSIPAAAMVGMREEAASEAGIPHVLGRALFVRNARSQIAGTTQGMLKLVVRKNDRRLLGVHLTGDEAAELVHIGQAVMHAEGRTFDRFLHTTFNIPTRRGAYKYGAYEALQKLNGRPRTITPLSAELTQ